MEKTGPAFRLFVLAAVLLIVAVAVALVVLIQQRSPETPPLPATSAAPVEAVAPPTASTSEAPPTGPPTLETEGTYDHVTPPPPKAEELVRSATTRLAEWEQGEKLEARQARLDGLIPADLIRESPWEHDLGGVEGAYVTVELGATVPGDPSKAKPDRIDVSQQVECTIHLPKGDDTETVSTVHALWHYTVDTTDPNQPRIIDVREPVRP